MSGIWMLPLLLLVSQAVLAQGLPTETIARCETAVLSQAQAALNPSREFSLDLNGQDGSRVVYFGVRHTFDSADPQFVAMQAAWDAVKPSAAFFEGTGHSVGETLAASVQQAGEPGALRFFAARAGVPSRSLEPTREAEVAVLLRRFTAEQLVLFYTTRSVAEVRERRGLGSQDADTVIAQNLARAHTAPQLSGVLPDVQSYRAAYSRWFPGMDPALASARWFDPRRTSAETGSVFFNDVDRESSAFRDVHMYRTLASAWRPGIRIFAEVGRDHIPAQAAALRCAWQ